MLCYVLLYSAILYHTITHYTMLCSAMLCHIHLFLVWGLAPGPKPQSPGPRRELVFDLGVGTWPKASEPQARAGELAPGLPPRPRALRLRARCQTKKNKKAQKSKETKKTVFQCPWVFVFVYLFFCVLCFFLSGLGSWL